MRVNDGDTVTVAPSGDAATPIVIRLYGIDAPEWNQPGGPEAHAALQALLPVHAQVEIIPADTDRYSRTVALVVHDGHAVNGVMVEKGHAWVYGQYCRAKVCGAWRKAQKKAQSDGLGLWGSDDPMPPWKWRHGR